MSLMTRKRILGASAALALAGASIGLAMGMTAADDPRHALGADEDRAEIRVGTYEPQVAFQSYRGAEELNRRMQELQRQLIEAQEQGDQQRAMELQTQAQQMQTEVIDEFYKEVERAIPEVAQEANVQIVAVEVVYTDPQIGEPRDLTQEIVQHMNDDDEAPGDESPALPW